MTAVTNEAVKCYRSLQLIFCKSADATVKNKIHRSLLDQRCFIPKMIRKLICSAQVIINSCRKTFQRNGSGWMVDYFVAAELVKNYFIISSFKYIQFKH